MKAVRKSYKLCVICGEKSLPGFKRGQNLCQYHWNMRIWGKSWADKCKENSSANQETK